MKKNLLLFSIFIAANVQAQTITVSSSAEECIRYIDNILQAILTQDSGSVAKKAVSFEGSRFTETSQYPTGSIFTYTSENIDWSTFRDIAYSANKGNMFLIFNFKRKFPSYDKGIADNKQLISFSMDMNDYFGLTIKTQDTAKLTELKIAATCLSQIASEKGSRLLLVKAPIVPIEGKPTYKETASFIKSYFNTDARKKHNTVATFWYDAGYLSSYSYRILYFEISECILYVGYEVLKTNYMTKVETKNVVTHKIDLSKIEDLKVQVTGTRDAEVKQQHFVNNIIFKIVDNPATIMLPFDNIPADAPNNGMETQIFKAFRQIKKLCGSPEPVVFD